MQHPVEAEDERRIMLNHDLQGIQLAAQAAVLTRQDIRSQLQNVVSPVLILVGANDLATPSFLAQEMQTLIPNAQLAIVPNAGHHLPLESPQRMTNEIIAFLVNQGM
ncbi:alpha/beta fold hydrolase [Stenomitos frigidus]|nr:alpha/beta hydrolase [Stenomitos frigidus]